MPPPKVEKINTNTGPASTKHTMVCLCIPPLLVTPYKANVGLPQDSDISQVVRRGSQGIQGRLCSIRKFDPYVPAREFASV